MSAKLLMEPAEVFYYFEQICNIPHGSYHKEQLSDYCVQFAKKHQLEVYQDSLKNVIIIKEATKGYEEVNHLFYKDIWTWFVKKNQKAQLIF